MRKNVLALAIILQLAPIAICQNSKNGVEMVFQLTNGQFFTPEFSLGSHWYDLKLNRYEYLIDLYAEADLSNESSSCCLIDVDKSIDSDELRRCNRSRDQRARIRWKLWHGSVLVAQGPKKGESSCDTIDIYRGRDFALGTFHAHDGKAFKLELDIDNVDPNIHFTQARLVVWPQPEM
jgi:hypothetical protein